MRYGVAERIDNQLGTGGFNADLPLPNPINRFQIMQVDADLEILIVMPGKLLRQEHGHPAHVLHQLRLFLFLQRVIVIP